MKVKRKALLFGIVFLTGMVPLTAYADEAQTEEMVLEQRMEDVGVGSATAESDFTWSGTVITGYTGSSTSVVIPEKATEIGADAFKNSTVESVSFAGNKVTKIGNNAFEACRSLKDVSLPDSLIELGDYVFWKCHALTDISIPKNVTKMGLSVFWNCSSLSSLEIKSSVLEDVGPYPYRGCDSLKTIVLSGSPSKIAGNMFEHATYLENITIPDTVTEIGDYAFNGCSALCQSVIPQNVTKIGSGVFQNCTSLNSVEIKSNVLENTGAAIFSGCSSLKTVKLSGSLAEIPGNMFNGATYLESITIPDTVTEIGDWAFAGCTSLSEVKISKNIMEIGIGAFQNCSSLKTVELSNGVSRISTAAFEGCTSLTELTFKADKVWIFPDVFKNDNSLTIYGWTGSDVEAYATKNNIPFVSVGHVPGWTNGSDGKMRLYDDDGNMVINQFAFDGSYTYYLQADGSPMTDRLTYHPDGEHIIYLDSNGHEVFNSFQYCPSVGYTCYFDSNGYIYKDQVTFVGDKTYYLNANGKMENEGWFRFGNGTDYGYANWDGTLNTGGFSYDPWGRVVFYHWNGMVARGLITDGQWYYLMDETDGHYMGSFPVN